MNNPHIPTLEQLLAEEKNWKELLFSQGEAPREYLGLVLPWMRIHLRERHPHAVVSFKLLASDTVEAVVVEDGKTLAMGLGHCSPSQRAARLAHGISEAVESAESNEVRLARIWAERDALNQLGLDLPEGFRRQLLDRAFKTKVVETVKYDGLPPKPSPVEGALLEGPDAPQPRSATPAPAAQAPLAMLTPAAGPAKALPTPPAAPLPLGNDEPRINAFRGALVSNGMDPKQVEAMPAEEVEAAWDLIRNKRKAADGPTKAEKTSTKAKRLALVKELRVLAEAGNSRALHFFKYMNQLTPGMEATDDTVAATLDETALLQRLDSAKQLANPQP